MLFDEALADAKKLREIAEQNAKNAIVEAVTPKIKNLIERQLLEQGEEKNDEEDILLGVVNELSEGPEWASDDSVWKKAEKEVDPEGKGKEKYNDPWAVVADVYKKMGGKVKESVKEQVSEDEFELNTESIKALSDLLKEKNEPDIETRFLKVENKFLKIINVNSDKETLVEIGNEIDAISKIITESDSSVQEKFSSFKTTLESMKNRLSEIFENKDSLVKENLENLKNKILRIKKTNKINNIQKNAYGISILKEAKKLCDEANALKENFEKNEIEQIASNLEQISNTYKEIKEMSKDKTLNEGEIMLKLTVPDEVSLSADDLGVEVVGAEDEEMDVAMADDEVMGGELPDEMDYEPDETDEMDDEDVVEIDENMLRQELDKIRNLSEVDASALDDFGDGEVVGEPFVDSDDEDLNVNDKKTGQSVKKESKNNDDQIHQKEMRINQLSKQLTEANEAVEKLRSQLKEVNLFNAKLLYTNKLIQNNAISPKQKVAIVESLDNAKSLREVQLLYKGLTESLMGEKTEEKKIVKESVKRKLILGSASKSTTSAAPSQASLNEDADGFSRWATLAGISKK